MLEATRPFGAPVRPFLSPQISCVLASEPWQLRAYWALRREVFCEETGLFTSSMAERDAQDARALPIVALSHCAGSPEEVIGVVRVYAAEGGIWYGGRLAVARAYRGRPAVGAGLIRAAVTTAIAHGCQRFVATVLASNADYFRRNGFRALAPLELCGRPHLLMEAELAAFGGERAA
jgi:putative N-acetyltransferase (TIGR04045 family)